MPFRASPSHCLVLGHCVAVLVSTCPQSENLITNFINGEFKPSASGAYLDVVAPATHEVVGRVTLSTADVRLACPFLFPFASTLRQAV